MERKTISPKELITKSHHIWNDQWFLLSCGDFEKNDFNCMTVAWGSIGTMWSRPFVQVVVRPTRFTHKFTEKYSDFTVAAFPEQYRRDLSLLGSISGRDGDKLARTSLNAIAAQKVGSPAYEEAELIIECRTIYSDKFDPEKFIDPSIDDKYSGNDYHTIYYGEIVHISGIDTYKIG